MPELILLSLSRPDFIKLHNAHLSGDKQATDTLKNMWADYEHRDDLVCFICDRPANRPIVCQILPENRVYEKLIAAPLCQRCFDLPNAVRLSRALKVLKKMYSAQTGKNITFSVNHPKHPHPR